MLANLLNEALCFDDVLLVPQYSEVESRSEVDLTATLSDDIVLTTPIVSANMDTITGKEMALAMMNAGAYGYVHRFMRDEDRLHLANAGFGMSIGVGEKEYQMACRMFFEGATNLCIDIAHGHSKAVIDQIERLKAEFQEDITICAGNVCTYAGTKALAKAGANIVKIGIGPGQVCSTRVVTGHGLPQLSAIAVCAQTKEEFPDLKLIADGGIRNSGDIVKALAAGADFIMSGSLFAGCPETPGDILTDESGVHFKQYRGMSSTEAQVARTDKSQAPRLAEGISTTVSLNKPAVLIVQDLHQGIQSGCTYSGARNLNELRRNAVFIKVTSTSLKESYPRPHG